ncbi:protein WVD2-like 2 [Abeliophyllum distichum]|uniref:Protein WVD2-like 2 n=1 Tax=Abeliophyllum distichum TaxID=126358 RepID=A0ABD1TG32_9LAMI
MSTKHSENSTFDINSGSHSGRMSSCEYIQLLRVGVLDPAPRYPNWRPRSGRHKKIYLQMGRNVAGLHVDKNSTAVNMKSDDTFHDTVHVAPKISSEKIETKDYELEDHAENGTVADECNGKQDLLGIKNTHHEPEQKSLKAEVQKSGDEKVNSLVKPESESAVNWSINTDSSEPLTPSVEDEKLTPYEIHANGTKTIDSGEKCSPKSNDACFTKTTRKSQTISHLVSRNPAAT